MQGHIVSGNSKSSIACFSLLWSFRPGSPAKNFVPGNLLADSATDPVKEETDTCETIGKVWVCDGAGALNEKQLHFEIPDNQTQAIAVQATQTYLKTRNWQHLLEVFLQIPEQLQVALLIVHGNEDWREIIFWMVKTNAKDKELHVPESPYPTATPLSLSVLAHIMSIVISPYKLSQTWFVKYWRFPVWISFG
jgi:hypothetical protein